MVHVLAAAAGLSALIATSALAFSTLKYAGAAFLIWLGLRRLTTPAPAPSASEPAPQRLLAVFAQGLLVNASNPKTALFFLAFLPQFVVPGRGEVAVQAALLGTIFLGIALCTDASWALLASRAGVWLRRHPWYLASERYAVGSVYLGLGVATALSGSGRSAR
jgi:threonine/homoserine/homoserine lactone efflux protein